MLKRYCILLKGRTFYRVFNEIKFVYFFFKLFKSKYNRSSKNRNSRIFPMIQGIVYRFFVLQFLFCWIYLVDEKVHNIDGFFLDASFYAVSLCQLIKSFKHVNSLLNGCNLFECEIYNILIHHVKLFYSCFEPIILIMPVWCFDIKNFVFLIAFELFDQFTERSSYLLQYSNYFRWFRPSELW